MKKLIAMLALVGTLGLVAAGCSGSDDDSADETTTTEASEESTTTEADSTELTEEQLVEALAANLSGGDEEGGDLVLAEDEAECVGAGWVEAIGVAALNESGVTLEEISDPGYGGEGLELGDEEGQAMVDAFGACDVDIVGEMGTSLAAGFTDEQIACVDENIDQELGEALLVKTFSNQDSDAEFEALIASLTEACDLPPA